MHNLSKYKPKNIDELILEDKILDPIINFANGWMQGFQDTIKPSILFYGKPGIGKTLTAKIIIEECEWNIIEINASDVKSKESLSKLLDVQKYDFFGKRNCVFLDEIDAPKEKDEGLDNIIKKVILKMRFPVIMCANDLKKVSKSLRDVSNIVQFYSPSEKSLKEYVLKINREEGLNLSQDVINAASKTRDYRSALKIIESQQHLITKERKPTSFDITKALMMGENIKIEEHADSANKKIANNVIYTIDENCSKYDILDKQEIFEILSLSDKYKKRGQIVFMIKLLSGIPKANFEIEDIKSSVYYEKKKNSGLRLDTSTDSDS